MKYPFVLGYYISKCKHYVSTKKECAYISFHTNR
jgi:hypothetical protein